ncbi:MAG TPA: hypothetical protein VK483_01350 [Chitinophagaceae bacterium]|nr:hypothetical protein [Chitinophagaceae bacterium]
MNTDIEIRYSTLPLKIIEDFPANFRKTEITVRVIKEEEYDNFTGGPADLIIYIHKHLEEFIIGGVTYDILKSSLQRIWRKLVQYYRKTKEKIHEDKNLIELNFEVRQNGTIEFNLMGDIDDKSIDNAVDKIFEYLRDQEKANKDLKTPDLMDANSSKPRIRMVYDANSNSWQPVNFTEMSKKFEELMREISQKFDN